MSDVKVFAFIHLKFLGKLFERLMVSQIIRLDNRYWISHIIYVNKVSNRIANKSRRGKNLETYVGISSCTLYIMLHRFSDWPSPWKGKGNVPLMKSTTSRYHIQHPPTWPASSASCPVSQTWPSKNSMSPMSFLPWRHAWQKESRWRYDTSALLDDVSKLSFGKI